MDTTIIRRDAEIRNFLEQKLGGGDIAAEVAQEALACDDAICFFDDLSRYGCVCGMVWRLIYYADTHAFFDAHYDEINELRQDWTDSVGEPLRIDGDLKNYLAWFAFEEVAYRLAGELGLV